jgi:hypothetical protein
MECVEMLMVTRILFMEFVVGDVYQAIVFGMFSEKKVEMHDRQYAHTSVAC